MEHHGNRDWNPHWGSMGYFERAANVPTAPHLTAVPFPDLKGKTIGKMGAGNGQFSRNMASAPGGAQISNSQHTTNQHQSSNETHIGEVKIHTQATDAAWIAKRYQTGNGAD